MIGFLALIALLSAVSCGIMLWAGYRRARAREPEPLVFRDCKFQGKPEYLYDLTKPEPPKLRLLQGGRK